jgi:hypothetical protein
LNAFSLPALNSATLCGLAASTWSMIGSMAEASVTCFRPCASMTASALAASPFHSASNTLRAMLLEMVSSATRSSTPASCAGDTGESPMAFSSRLRRAATSPITQLAAGFAWAAPAAATTASK